MVTHRFDAHTSGCTANEDPVMTAIGSGTRGHRDGAAREAAMHRLFGLCAVRADGRVLAFTDCHNNALRIVCAAEDTVACSVHTIQNAGLLTPKGLYTSDDGRYLFVCDTGHHRIRFAALTSLTSLLGAGIGRSEGGAFARKVDVFAFAGSGKKGWSDGLVQEASFNAPLGICEYRDSTIMVGDTGNHCIRSFRRSGRLGGKLVIDTIAGGG